MLYLLDSPPAQPSAFSGVILLSGLLGALAAAIVSIIAAYLIDRRTKAWNLQAELRRHLVSRLIEASSGLRKCFFQAFVELRYHRLAMSNAEAECNTLRNRLVLNAALMDSLQLMAHEKDIDREMENLKISELIRYNGRISQIEAEAQSHLGTLDSPVVPSSLYKEANEMFAKLTQGHTADTDSVTARLALFENEKPSLIRLTSLIDDAISIEIVKPIK